MYNISYATSITGALSLYDYSKTNYTDAKLKYMSACYNENMDDDIEEIFEKCGLNSPFSEEMFLKIKKLVEEKGK